MISNVANDSLALVFSSRPIKMSPRFVVLGRENVPCVAEAVNRSLKADCADFTHLPGTMNFSCLCLDLSLISKVFCVKIQVIKQFSVYLLRIPSLHYSAEMAYMCRDHLRSNFGHFWDHLRCRAGLCQTIKDASAEESARDAQKAVVRILGLLSKTTHHKISRWRQKACSEI